MEKELGFVVNLEAVLGGLEVELRDICDSHDDIFSIEHKQMKELLKVLISVRKDVTKIGGKLIPPSDFDLKV